MPFAEWWLKKWSPAGNDPNFVKVQIDPVEVWGCRGAFGPMLVLPYKLPKGEGPSASLELLSLEGWIGVPTFFPPKIPAKPGWLTAHMSHCSAKKLSLVTI